MRKNLFLTLALVLASFAGAMAQNWSVTLGAAEGLPGETVSKDGANLKYYKSGIIRADKPIKTLRFTCAGNSTNHKPNGNNFRLMLSELNVYSAEDLAKELKYTVKTNADHVTLAKAFDGQGLRALYDGKYNNYFSSMSAAEGAVAEYHYLELTFEQEISRFVIEWGGKQGSGEAPSVVVLTEGGVTAEPYADRATSFSEDKINTIEALEEGYFTICGNAPTSYDTYNNQTGEKTSKEPVAGSGPMYVTMGDVYAEAPSIDYITKLVPVGDGTYYIYFPMQKKYLNGNATDNAFNNAQNGWQYATNDIAKAAKVTLTPLANGDFEMSYKTTYKGDNSEFNGDVYIGADPRTGKMKIFSKVKKEALEANKWCEGFGLVCAFNWSFYAAEYSAPTWAKEYEVGNVYIAIKNLQAVVEDDGTVADVIASLEESMANIEDMDESEIEEVIAGAKEEISSFIYDAASNEYDEMEGEWDKWKRNSKTSFVATCYPMTAYNEYIAPGAALIEGILESDAAYEIIEDVTNYFANKEANIAAFQATKYALQSLPLEYAAAAEATALGTLEGNAYVWEQNVGLDKKVNGFRLTFVETNIGNSGGGGKYNGYPMVALGELEIFDEAGEKIALDASLITTNSQETSEGPMENLVDGSNDSFWHSIWGNGTMNPQCEVYLDIKLPAETEIDIFSIKVTGRNNKSLSPKRVVISEYNRAYNDVDEVVLENPYNVALGAKVTDVAQLQDGGLYILQGNLNVNKEEGAAKPRFYAGATPYSDDARIAADAPCVYMFKKAGDCWNILSLSNAKYWVDAPDYGAANLSIYKAVAGNVKLVASQNLENTFVIYSEIDSTLTARFNWTDKNDSTNVIKIDSTDVKATAVVYMDWDSGLASRPCYSPIPGELDPQFVEQLAGNEGLKLTSSAGDYLHFNKTNGEGEWSIYEATMDDAYFAYLTALVAEVNNLDLVPGVNPGCIIADAETGAAFENAKAAANAAVNADKKNNAEKLSTDLIAAVEELSNSERVGFDPEKVYRIESGLTKYEQNTWATRSVYADAETSTLKWTVTPNNFEEENQEFLYNIIPVDEEINTIYRLEIADENLGKVYIIKLLDQDQFAGAHDDATNNFLVTPQPVAYWINNLAACNFEVKTATNNRYWHTEGHAEGNGYGGRLVNWNCGNNLNTASSWTFINMTDYDDTSVEDLVVEGDEVVSVSYFTPAGTAIPAPVKGINIIVTVYANGVVEAKKKLVK